MFPKTLSALTWAAAAVQSVGALPQVGQVLPPQVVDPQRGVTNSGAGADAVVLPTPAKVEAAPEETLPPAVYWKVNKNDVANVKPLPDQKLSTFYYGVADKTKAGNYAFVDYTFNEDTVNLDHCGYATAKNTAANTLAVKFTNKEAFELAKKTWTTNMVLITSASVCADAAKKDRCYLAVKSMTPGDMTITAKTAPSKVESLYITAKAKWGWYEPAKAEPRALGAAASGLERRQSKSSKKEKTWNYSVEQFPNTIIKGLLQLTEIVPPLPVVPPWPFSFRLPLPKGGKKTIPAADGVNAKASVDLWMVNSTTSGSFSHDGEVEWSPKGVQKLSAVAQANVDFDTKFGVDIKGLSVSKDFFAGTLLEEFVSFGMAGLSFGRIHVGPRFFLGSAFEVDASVSTKVLVPVSFKLSNAKVSFDYGNGKETSADKKNLVPKIDVSRPEEISGELTGIVTGSPIVGVRFGFNAGPLVMDVSTVLKPMVKAKFASSLVYKNSDGLIKPKDDCRGVTFMPALRLKAFVQKHIGKTKSPFLELYDRPDENLLQSPICITARAKTGTPALPSIPPVRNPFKATSTASATPTPTTAPLAKPEDDE